MGRGKRKVSSIQKCESLMSSSSASALLSPVKPKSRRFKGRLSHTAGSILPNKITKYYNVKLNLLENSIILTAVVNINVRQDSRQDDLKRNVLHETNIRLEDNRHVNKIWDAYSGNSQTRITEFFPVRRSIRKTKKTVLEEKRKTLEKAILSNKEDGLDVRIFGDKGRGVVAARKFEKGEFVVEYAGELISMEEARRREAVYARYENVGCYMYYFKHRNNQHCIDATAETGRLGRLLNHSRNGNLSTKAVEVDGMPRLILLAKEDIEPGSELTYDYGDRSKLSLQHYPWLAQ